MLALLLIEGFFRVLFWLLEHVVLQPLADLFYDHVLTRKRRRVV